MLQLLLGGLSQEALVALVGEVHLECYETRSRNRYSESSDKYNSQSTTNERGIDLIG